MIINLWYNNSMNQWRWTLTDANDMSMEAGQQPDLRAAMNDVANTVEHLMRKSEQTE